MLGASAMRLPDPALLVRMIEHFNLPFATTTMAKGLIDEDHPLSLGCIERACRQVQRRCCVPPISSSASATTPSKSNTKPGSATCRCCKSTSSRPISRLRSSFATRSSAICHRRWHASPRARQPPIRGSRTRSPPIAAPFQAALRPANAAFTAHAAIDAVRRALPRDGVLAFDVGAHTHQIASQWPAHAPKSFLITNGWSSMGFGLPGAIAAKLARPDLPVVCLIGDGCFQMTCGEVATAKRLGITLPIVVLDDKWLALIKVKQIRRQFPLYGTELQAEDYREPPAHYFGVPAHGVRSAEALEHAVKTALAAGGPTVIEAVVDSEHYIDTVYD